MKDPNTDYRQAVALFRYGLIADLVRLQPGAKGLYAMIEQKAAGEVTVQTFLCAPLHRQRDGHVQVHRLGAGPAHRA
jgi:hypothetical protein